MSKPMTPRQRKKAYKKWGVKARYYSGWRHRGRPASLGWGSLHGFLVHHTGSDGGASASYRAFLFKAGRPGIPGPLCQETIQDDGTLWVGAIGRANHAGRGSSRTYGKVRSEKYPGYQHEIDPGPDNFDGNAVYEGTEVQYSGYHGMSQPQYATLIRSLAAKCDFYGWTAKSAIGHKEHSGRKWDPGHEQMDHIRRDVRDLLEAGPPGKKQKGSNVSKSFGTRAVKAASRARKRHEKANEKAQAAVKGHPVREKRLHEIHALSNQEQAIYKDILD